MDKVICPNCGASIYENEPKCPFCGYINITGAEEKFMRDVQKTEEDLSQIPEMQKKHLKKSLSKNSKIILITIAIVAGLAAVVFGFHLLVEHLLYGNYEYDPKAEMQWQKENYPILDEMLAEGKYDEIIEFETGLYEENRENNTNHSIYDWEHFDFISAYGNYLVFLKALEPLDKGVELDEYYAENLVYYGLWFYYRMYDNSYDVYTEEEFAQIEEYREEVMEILFGRLGFTEEEILSIEEDVLKDGYLELKACWKYAKKVMARFQ